MYKNIIQNHEYLTFKDKDIQNINLLVKNLSHIHYFCFKKVKKRDVIELFVHFVIFLLVFVGVFLFLLPISLFVFKNTLSIIGTLIWVGILLKVKFFKMLYETFHEFLMTSLCKRNYAFLTHYFQFDEKKMKEGNFYAILTLYNVLFFLFKFNLLNKKRAEKLIAFQFDYQALIDDFIKIQNSQKEYEKRKIHIPVDCPEIKRLLELEIYINENFLTQKHYFKANKKLLTKIKQMFVLNQDVISQDIAKTVADNVKKMTNKDLFSKNPTSNVSIKFLMETATLEKTKELLETNIKQNLKQ